MGGWRAGGEGREMELPQRGDRRGTTGSACRIDSLSSRERYHRMCVGDSELGYLLWRGEGGHLVERPPHPAKALSAPGCRQRLPLAGGVGRRVPVTTSPRLELELSPDLLCGWGSKGTGGEHRRAAGGRGAAGLQLGRACVRAL